MIFAADSPNCDDFVPITLEELFEDAGIKLAKTMFVGETRGTGELWALDGKNRAEPIKSLKSYGIGPVYKVRLEDGTELHCSPDHKFLVDGNWKRVDEIEKGDIIAKL